MTKEISSGKNLVKGFKDFKSYVDRINSDALSGLTDNINKTKETLFNIAESNKENNNDTVTGTESTAENNNNSNFDFRAGGFKPDLTNLGSYNPNVDIAANLKKGNFYTNVNVEGKKQLNKYLDLSGFANTKGDYGATLGFDFKF